MKTIYLFIEQRLTTVAALKTIDIDYGQIDAYTDRPAVVFPCALLKLNIVGVEDLGDGEQLQTIEVAVRLAFDPLVKRSSAGAPESARIKSLEVLDIADEVMHALHRFSNFDGDASEYAEGEFSPISYDTTNFESFAPLYHQSTIDEDRADNFKVFRLSFTTSRIK